MFKITEERIINIVLALGMLIFIVVAKVSDEEKKTAKINELKMNSNETEAITYNYRIDRVLKGKYHETKQMVSYIYFHNNQEFKHERILGNLTDKCERFKKPLVFRLIYSKNKPEIHELVLTYSLDSITNDSLRNFAVSYFGVLNIQEFYKLQASK